MVTGIRHWIVLARSLVAPTLAAVVLLLAVNVILSSLLPGWVRLLLTAATVAGLGGMQVLSWLQWTSAHFIVTSRRLILDLGPVHRLTKVIQLDDVRNVSTGQTLLGQMLDYGSVEIDTVQVTELLMYVVRPGVLRDQLFVLAEQRRRSR